VGISFRSARDKIYLLEKGILGKQRDMTKDYFVAWGLIKR